MNRLALSINWEAVSNLRFAYNWVIIANRPSDLQHLFEHVIVTCARYTLDMILKKTKFMIIVKHQNTNDNKTLEKLIVLE